MKLTRRTVIGGGAIVAAAGALPAYAQREHPKQRKKPQPAKAPQPAPATTTAPQPARSALYVRESLAQQIKYKSPLIEAYRRGIDSMMRLPTWDRRNYWFQAYMYGVAASQIPPDMQPSAASHFNKSPQRNFFFLAWNRMYLYFFERILRAGAGDARFVLPYWAFEDPNQSRVPEIFLPDPAETTGGTDPYARRNPLARAIRHPQIDRGLAGLRGDIGARTEAALQLGTFFSRDKSDPNHAFGGAFSQSPTDAPGIGGLEAIHNDVHDTLGLFGGDLGSVLTAARDPLFFAIHANIDRLWSKWTNPAAGREPPIFDNYWNNTVFTFIDENGADVKMSGAHIVDQQHQLRYRYEDEYERDSQYTFAQVAQQRVVPPSATLIARAGAMRLGERDNRTVFPAVASLSMTDVQSAKFRLVVRDIDARDRTSPYDVLLGGGIALPVAVGTIALYGGGRSERSAGAAPVTMTFDATAAVQQIARAVGGSLTGLGVIVVRRGLMDASGQELVSVDPNPPGIGSIELIKV